MHWLVLIYTLPPEPTRKRAFIWRELKKVGAVYLRDGVGILPDRPATRQAVQAIVDRVRAYEGRATAVEAALIDDLTAQDVVRQSRAARQTEYTALTDSSRELLDHVRRELPHRDFSEAEIKSLLEDVGKLWRWYDQICARDYFAADAAATASAAIAECESAIRNLRVGVGVR